jgi:Zn-finger nucleic acid-binding protein
MQCPIDGAELRVSDRQGVEIDYCPTCRGVWLDRGELDKIIDRMGRSPERVERAEPERAAAPRREEYDYDDDRRGNSRPRKRRSFLDDLFDFD